jgi:hypothetical protein
MVSDSRFWVLDSGLQVHGSDLRSWGLVFRPRVQGSGFRVQDSGFRVQGSGFRVQGSGFRVQGSGFRARGSGFRARGSGFKAQDSGFRVQGSGFRVQGSGFQVWKVASVGLSNYPKLTCRVCGTNPSTLHQQRSQAHPIGESNRLTRGWGWGGCQKSRLHPQPPPA